MRQDNDGNPLDDDGNPLEERAFYRIKMRVGRPVPPHPLLLKRVISEPELNIIPKFYFENFMGEEVVRNTYMDDSVHRYTKEELRNLVSEYRSIASWIEQLAQTSPSCTPHPEAERCNGVVVHSQKNPFKS